MSIVSNMDMPNFHTTTSENNYDNDNNNNHDIQTTIVNILTISQKPFNQNSARELYCYEFDKCIFVNKAHQHCLIVLILTNIRVKNVYCKHLTSSFIFTLLLTFLVSYISSFSVRTCTNDNFGRFNTMK